MENKKIGDMVFKGMLVGSRSYHNLTLDVLRNCIKYYILKNNNEKAIWSVLEMDNFYHLGNAECIRSAMMSRLFEIYINNYAINNPNFIFIFNDFEKKWQDNRLTNYNYSKQILITLVDNMASLEKDYTINIIKYIYSYLASKKVSSIKSEEFQEFYSNTKLEIAHDEYQLGDYWFNHDEKDPNILISYMDNFIYNFDNNSENIFYWLYMIYELSKQKIRGKRRYKRWKPIYAIWEHLEKRVSAENMENPMLIESFQILLSYYLKNDNIDILVYACFIIFKQVDISQNIEYPEYITLNKLDKYQNWHLNNNIEVDDFCLDKSIKEGRKYFNNYDFKRKIDIFSSNIFPNLNPIFNYLQTSTVKQKTRKKKKIDDTPELIEDDYPGINTPKDMNYNSNQSENIKKFMKIKD